MTVSTLEKARELRKRNECWGELTPQQIANFADSLTAELQKENAELKEFLQLYETTHEIVNQHGNTVSCACYLCLKVRAALSKEKAQ